MGIELGAMCKKCGTHFKIHKKIGYGLHLTRCDKCGHENMISFSKIGDLIHRYKEETNDTEFLCSNSTQEYSENSGDKSSFKQFQEAIESGLEKCDCGGSFKYGAPHRCPECQSDEYEQRGRPRLIRDE